MLVLRSALRFLPRARLFSGDTASSSSPSSTTSESTSTLAAAIGESEGSNEGASGKDRRQLVLEKALGHVHRYGWSEQSVKAALVDLNLSPAALGMFPRGAGAELALYVVESSNLELSRTLANTNLRTLPVRERLKSCIRTRLLMLEPFMASWPQAMALLASPPMLPDSLRQGALLVDEIWHHCGDTSIDHKWYLKRAALAGVYGATELYMLRDRSAGFKETWGFLDRRLDELEWLGDVHDQFSKSVNAVATTLFRLLPLSSASSSSSSSSSPSSSSPFTSGSSGPPSFRAPTDDDLSDDFDRGRRPTHPPLNTPRDAELERSMSEEDRARAWASTRATDDNETRR